MGIANRDYMRRDYVPRVCGPAQKSPSPLLTAKLAAVSALPVRYGADVGARSRGYQRRFGIALTIVFACLLLVSWRYIRQALRHVSHDGFWASARPIIDEPTSLSPPIAP